MQEKDRLQAFSKLTEVLDGERCIKHQPPLIFRLEELHRQAADLRARVIELANAYIESLEDSHKRLL